MSRHPAILTLALAACTASSEPDPLPELYAAPCAPEAADAAAEDAGVPVVVPHPLDGTQPPGMPSGAYCAGNASWAFAPQLRQVQLYTPRTGLVLGTLLRADDVLEVAWPMDCDAAVACERVESWSLVVSDGDVVVGGVVFTQRACR